MVKIKGTWANVCSWWRYVMKLKRQFSLTPNEALNFTPSNLLYSHSTRSYPIKASSFSLMSQTQNKNSRWLNNEC